ncbi:hypothetical protein LTR53_006753 [Teratosphaeriaceae sp. CCFEE 6253]|nr:hypothetical protein LTR53_006753 [Teratosphaeriaceae sp. CCFEE 6253]
MSTSQGVAASLQDAPDTRHPLDDVALLEGYKIRLIQLLPGVHNDTICIKLIICDLETAPSYDALSYVWGPGVDRTIIQCHDRARDITGTLCAALQRVRYRTQSRLIWADAICINQKSTAEKSHHVGFMDKVYARATRVLVCMGGDADGGADNVVALLKEHTKRMGTIAVKAMPVLPSDDALFADRRWRSVASVFGNAWFGRAWVIQEVGKAKDPRVLYDTVEFSYRTLMQMARWITHSASQLQQRAGVYLLTVHTDWEEWTPNWRASVDYQYSLVDLMSHAKGLGCSVTHDHVYSLLGHPLARNDKDEPLVKPNYATPVGDVFVQLSAHMLSTLGLKVLSAVEHTKISIEEDLPSWAARWDMDIIWNSFGYFPDFYFRASGPEPDNAAELWKPEFRKTSPDVLSVSAIPLGTIQDIFAFPLAETGKETIAAKTSDWDLGTAEEVVGRAHGLVATLGDIYAYLSNRLKPDERSDTLSLTLCAGLTNFGEAEEDLATHRANFAAFWHLVAQSLAIPDIVATNPGHGDADAFWRDLNLSCKGRSFFITSEGHCGLGPLFSRQGDSCYLFKSARVPFVVRKSRGGRSKLLGEAYVHGAMHGELVRDPESAEMWTTLDLI